MAARILVGVLVVLGSWALLTILLVALGRWAAISVDPTRGRRALLRASLWWGLGLATVVVLTSGFAVGLASAVAAWVVVGCAVVLGVVGLVLRAPRLTRPVRPHASVLALLGAFAAAALYLAFKALGPVTNYDTGLYHLGSIKYAADFSAIPGIATLYFPFGYANAQFPLAAVLGNGPWDGSGYRLLNGLLVVLVIIDVTLRLLSPRRSWGTYVMAVGLTAALVPLVAMADALTASPTSDTAVLLLTLVATAYLADLLERRRPVSLELSVVIVTTGLAVAMRPTMLVFAIGVLGVLIVTLVRRPSTRPRAVAPWLFTAAWSAAIVALVLLRDRILSGWLLYPLSIAPVDVPWRVPDPTPWRDATLAAARDPAAPDQYAVAHSWSWIGAWIERLPSQWEFWFLLAGLATTLVVTMAARRRANFPRRPRALLLSLAPGALAVVAWFTVSPPSFRFIWGPLFCLMFLVIGAALRDLSTAPTDRMGGRVVGRVLVACATVVLLVTGYSAVARNQADQITEQRTWSLWGLSIPYAVAPVPLPPVQPEVMQSGLVIFTPASGDEQCWDNYPLCTFSMGNTIALRGDTLQDGFTRSR